MQQPQQSITKVTFLCKPFLQVEAQEMKVIHANHNKVQHSLDFRTTRSDTKISNETIYVHIKKQSQFVVKNVNCFVSHTIFNVILSEGIKRYHCEEMS